ncbi:MAG: cytochrome c-type biogenesis protein [Dehalococcoidia bacterium]
MRYRFLAQTGLLAFAIAVIALVPLASPAAAQGPGTDTAGPDQDRALERRAQKLEKQLICPVCPGETLDQSFVDIAQDMKRIIREKLSAGETEGEILDYFVARYGDEVLAAPPKSGFNLIAWVAPPIGIALGLVAVVLILRQMRRPGAHVPAGGPAPGADLAPYLDAVDRDLALADEPPAPEQPQSGRAGPPESMS